MPIREPLDERPGLPVVADRAYPHGSVGYGLSRIRITTMAVPRCLPRATPAELVARPDQASIHLLHRSDAITPPRQPRLTQREREVLRSWWPAAW